jgi:hypothetical protein
MFLRVSCVVFSSVLRPYCFKVSICKHVDWEKDFMRWFSGSSNILVEKRKLLYIYKSFKLHWYEIVACYSTKTHEKVLAIL